MFQWDSCDRTSAVPAAQAVTLPSSNLKETAENGAEHCLDRGVFCKI